MNMSKFKLKVLYVFSLRPHLLPACIILISYHLSACRGHFVQTLSWFAFSYLSI
jgi:hypothetical protein